MNARVGSVLATCIGCGCDDDHACTGGCEWLRIDCESGLGVCSGCPTHEARWDSGDRSIWADGPDLTTEDEGFDLEDAWDEDDPASGIILPGDAAFDDTLAEIRRR